MAKKNAKTKSLRKSVDFLLSGFYVAIVEKGEFKSCLVDTVYKDSVWICVLGEHKHYKEVFKKDIVALGDINGIPLKGIRGNWHIVNELLYKQHSK